MSERRVRITDDVAARQRTAADPSLSAWVSANAGSGKTHVLTERVLRLLLTGVAPEAILCLTYTKAAAAEMRRRVAARLGEWVLLEDATLDERLAAATGAPPDAALRDRARTLFARALETPGGLKINTIHAFCEAVLHRFPLEAGVPLGFRVIEEEEHRELLRLTREEVLAEGLADHPGTAEAVGTLFALMSDHQIAEAIGTAFAEGRRLRAVLADPAAAKANLRALLALPEGMNEAALDAEAAALMPTPEECARLFALTPPAPGGGRRFEDRLALLGGGAVTAEAFCAAFLTGDGEVPKSMNLKKAISDADPALAERIAAITGAAAGLLDRLRAVRLAARSGALLDVLHAITARYERAKRARSLLDFDDLVERIALLFHNEAAAWVRYKLDTGIAHILVDESQDTNPEQWQVVRAIAEEFFAGHGAERGVRTLFAVGDEKQSIYSFQGADPHLFGTTGADFRRRAVTVGLLWEQVRLRASFRTLPGILAGVDLVGALPGMPEALINFEGHESARNDAGGSITLWPPVQQQAAPEIDGDWPVEVTELVPDASRRLADGIARTIAGWIEAKRPLGQRGRAVVADDVLVLVQSRGPLFHLLIRALKSENVATPGADRLAVTRHIAVLDLIALGEAMLLPGDDLTLATVLRSPLIGIDGDQLEALCAPRSGPVWGALRALAEREPWARAAHERLSGWRARLDIDRPFEFFARVLYADGGLKRLHGRLGTEIDDVIAEFLDLALAHERSAQPGLPGFLAEMRRREVEIKRELAERGGGVRVMTVHGAKGLEAPIVILADAATAPAPQKLGKPVYAVAERPPGPLLVHAGRKGDHAMATLSLRMADEDNQRAEYWRKLYVGMTRAEDELYLTGVLDRRPGEPEKKLAGTWYGRVAEALAAGGAPLPSPIDGAEGLVFPAIRPAPKSARAEVVTPAAPPPAIDTGPLPPPTRVPTISPSDTKVAAEPERVLETAAEAVRDAATARRRGVALHALLQHLGGIAPADRPAVAQKALDALLPEAPALHAGMTGKALRILGDPAHAALFGPYSRAEVPFAAEALRDGRRVRIAGRIDRLLVEDGRVLVVDFKSDAAPAARPADVGIAYRTQLGLYAMAAKRLFPGREIGAAIFWIESEVLMLLAPELLADATRAFSIG